MATEDAGPPPADAPAPTPNAPDRSSADDGICKRKVSPARDLDDGSAKRARQGRDDGGSRPRKPSASPDGRPAVEHERRESATQEERKRGKRLFGGLLGTLSQTASSSQQKRRQEIERRQLEKMQQQTAEDGKQRAEKRAALHKVRMEQQIAWEEQVMRSRHAKELKLAQFLRTRSEPEIYYLPWKLTRKEEDMIDDQMRDTKASIARELKDFKEHKEQHLRRHGPRRESHANSTEQLPAPGPEPEASPPTAPTTIPDKAEEQPAAAAHNNAHDDSNDILVEAEEDMVIY